MDDLYAKAAVDARYSDVSIDQAAAILREHFIPRVTGPHDGLIDALKKRAATYSWDSTTFYVSDADTMRNAAAAIASLQSELAKARELIHELADDLEAEVKDRWGFDERLKRQLNRDMDVVNRARAALGDKQ